MAIFKKWPVNVSIFEKRGEGVVVFRDKGSRIQKKHGETYYQIKKKKIKIPPVNYQYIYRVMEKGKIRQWIFLYSVSPYVHTPLELKNDLATALENGSMTVEQAEQQVLPNLIKKRNAPAYDIAINSETAWMQWKNTADRITIYRTEYKSTLEKILPIAMVATTGIIIGIMLYMTIGQMQLVSNAFSSAMDASVKVSQNLETVARLLTNSPATATPPF